MQTNWLEWALHEHLKKPTMIPTKTLALSVCSALLLGLCTNALADDYGYYSDNQLQAPDVSFYAALQAASSNLHYLGGDREAGFNLLVGGYFNDVKIAGLRYGVEFGYQGFGESKNSSSRQLSQTELGEIQDNPSSGDLTTINKQRLSSLSFGGRFEGELFFMRFGGSIYNYHQSSQRLVHYVYPTCPGGPGVGCPSTQQDPTYSESASSLAPYLGFGLHLPVPWVDHLRLTAGYDVYNVESHRVENVNIGLMYTD